MSRARSESAAALLVVAVALAACGGGDDQACTEIGCGAGATIKVDLGLSFNEVRAATLSVCRNDVCVDGTFSDLNAPPSPGTGVGFAVIPGPDAGTGGVADGLVMARANGSLWLQVFWRSNLGELADGDVYRLTVKDVSAREVVTFMGTATYGLVYPNGKDCPPSCRVAEFDQHSP